MRAEELAIQVFGVHVHHIDDVHVGIWIHQSVNQFGYLKVHIVSYKVKFIKTSIDSKRERERVRVYKKNTCYYYCCS